MATVGFVGEGNVMGRASGTPVFNWRHHNGSGGNLQASTKLSRSNRTTFFLVGNEETKRKR